MYSFLTKYKLVWITLASMIVAFFVLGHHHVFLTGPNGIHVIRQTDSLSFVSQYYNQGFHFFQPANFNMVSLGGRAACEFPIYYYLTALLYSLYGILPALLKIAHVLTVYIGVLYFVKLAKIEIKSVPFALLSGLFLFTSTVFNDYSFNYLPDAEALGLTLIGITHYRLFQAKHLNRHLHYGTILFLLAGLIKVTYLIYPIAFVVFEVASLLIFKEKTWKGFSKRMATHVGVIILLVGIWNVYMLYYNELNHSEYYLTHIKPIWSLSGEQIAAVWDAMLHIWNSSYLSHPSMLVLLALILVQIVFYRHSNKELLLLNGILMMGNTFYFVLFFHQFKDHDYYMLVLFPMVGLMLVNGFYSMQAMKWWNMRWIKEGVIVFMVLLVIYGMRYSGLQLNDRRSLEENRLAEMGFAVRDNRLSILDLAPEKDAMFVVAPEPAPNASLFYLNRMGWTITNVEDITSKRIAYFVTQGADYLILPEAFNTSKLFSDTKSLMKKNGIQLIDLRKSR